MCSERTFLVVIFARLTAKWRTMKRRKTTTLLVENYGKFWKFGSWHKYPLRGRISSLFCCWPSSNTAIRGSFPHAMRTAIHPSFKSGIRDRNRLAWFGVVPRTSGWNSPRREELVWTRFAAMDTPLNVLCIKVFPRRNIGQLPTRTGTIRKAPTSSSGGPYCHGNGEITVIGRFGSDQERPHRILQKRHQGDGCGIVSGESRWWFVSTSVKGRIRENDQEEEVKG